MAQHPLEQRPFVNRAGRLAAERGLTGEVLSSHLFRQDGDPGSFAASPARRKQLVAPTFTPLPPYYPDQPFGGTPSPPENPPLWF